ncbi:hypothetical protein B0H14DRAFT_2578960 [Mycena olivaceomarginata]|nr:hypothetical protein B0H14DRAFT_2578960 [Mycena olivaceomarginata]
MRPSTWEARPGKWDARGVLRSRQTVDASRGDVLQRGLRMYGIRGKFIRPWKIRETTAFRWRIALDGALLTSRRSAVSSTPFGTMCPVVCANTCSSSGKWFRAARSSGLCDCIRWVMYHREDVVARSVTDRGREWCSGLSELLPSLIVSLGGWRVHASPHDSETAAYDPIALLSNSSSGATFPNQPAAGPDARLCFPSSDILARGSTPRTERAAICEFQLTKSWKKRSSPASRRPNFVSGRQIYQAAPSNMFCRPSLQVFSISGVPVTPRFHNTGCRSSVTSGLFLSRLDPTAVLFLSVTFLSIGPIDPGCPQQGVTTEFNAEARREISVRWMRGGRLADNVSTSNAFGMIERCIPCRFLVDLVHIAQHSMCLMCYRAKFPARDTGENESLEEDTTSI